MSEDIVYSKKMVVSHEIGAGNVLEPSREFKAFNSINSDNILKYEIPFIQRLGKFAGACLNRRINGTIYFGIADDKDKNGNYKHGEIIGLNIKKHQGDVFEEWVKYEPSFNKFIFDRIVITEAAKILEDTTAKLNLKLKQLLP